MSYLYSIKCDNCEQTVEQIGASSGWDVLPKGWAEMRGQTGPSFHACSARCVERIVGWIKVNPSAVEEVA